MSKNKNNKFLWNLYEHGVTASFLNSYTQCKYQTYLRYVLGWRAKRTPLSFMFGNVCHYVLSEAYHLTSIKEKGVLQFFSDTVSLYEQANFRGKASSTEEIKDQELALMLAEVILPIYFMHYPKDLERNILYNETTFEAKFGNIPLRGRVDAVFEKNNVIQILDTKCMSVIDEETIEEYLPYDPQCMLYSCIMRELHPDSPITFTYNIIRRPTLRQGKLTLSEFATKIRKDVLERLDHYFKRIPITISAEEMDFWKSNFLQPLIHELEDWQANYYMPRYYNPNALITKYGRCDLFDLITKGNTIPYYQVTTPFTELE